MNVTLPKSINLNFSPQVRSSRNSVFEAVLLLVVCGLFYWFIISPKMTAVAEQKVNLAQAQTEKDNISGTVSDLKKMVGQLSANAKEISALDEAMPLDAKILRLRLLLEDLGRSVGLSVSNVNVSGNTDAPWAGDKALLENPYLISRSVQRLSGTISAEGNYGQVIAFLDKIENSGRIININSVNIDSSADGNLSILLTLDAFYLAPNTK